MDAHRFFRAIGRSIRSGAWWLTIGPYCWANDVPQLTIGPHLVLHLGGDSSLYVANELLGRIVSLRGRLRLARTMVILLRAVLLSVIILLAAHLIQLATNQPISPWLPLVIFLVVGWSLHLALHHTISPFEVGRVVDRQLGLNALVATAVEGTLNNRLDRPLVRNQIRAATGRIRDVEPSQVIPLTLPARDLRLLVLALGLYALTLAIGIFGISLPRAVHPLDAIVAKQSDAGVQAPSPFVTVDSSQVPPEALVGAPMAGQSGNDLEQQATELRQQYQSNAITQEQYQQQLQQLQQEIQQQATESLAAQEALNALATALKDGSSTNDISNNLMRGDYQGAAEQLRDLSQQLAQLSPDARRELADRLAQASAQSKDADSAISKDSADAASALQKNDLGQASQSIQSLAQSVQQASDQIAQQAQLGQALQDVQQQLESQGSAAPSADAGAGQAEQPNSSAQSGVQGDTSSSLGAAGDDAAAPSGEGGAGQLDSRATEGMDGAGAAGASGASIQEALANSGGAGNSAGSAAVGASSNSLDINGVKLTIVGQPSGQGSASTTTGDRSIPLTASDGSAIAGAGGSTTGGSNVPINVHGESNVVPLDRKPVVRDYFSNGN